MRIPHESLPWSKKRRTGIYRNVPVLGQLSTPIDKLCLSHWTVTDPK